MPGIKYITRVLRGVRFEKLNYVMGVVKQKSGHSKARTFCDILWCAARYGAGYYDYVMFGFYGMNGKQRDTYLTRVRNKKVCELMNQPGYGDEFDDKLRFNVRFADFLGRRTLNAAAATPDELSAFLQGLDCFFAKPSRGTCGNGNCTECHTYGFENLAEAFKLTAGFLRSLAALLDGFLVLVQLTVHIVEGGLGIVELDLPVLGAAVAFSERGGGILQSLAKSVDFCSLLIDLFSQHLVPCGKCLHGFVVFIKLRGGELHFGAEHLERLVDVRQCFLEFFFALKTDLQSETVCHSPSPP